MTHTSLAQPTLIPAPLTLFRLPVDPRKWSQERWLIDKPYPRALGPFPLARLLRTGVRLGATLKKEIASNYCHASQPSHLIASSPTLSLSTSHYRMNLQISPPIRARKTRSSPEVPIPFFSLFFLKLKIDMQQETRSTKTHGQDLSCQSTKWWTGCKIRWQVWYSWG